MKGLESGTPPANESNRDFLARFILDAQEEGGLAKLAEAEGVDPNITLDEHLTDEDLSPSLPAVTYRTRREIRDLDRWERTPIVPEAKE